MHTGSIITCCYCLVTKQKMLMWVDTDTQNARHKSIIIKKTHQDNFFLLSLHVKNWPPNEIGVFVFLFSIKHHLKSGSDFACSLCSSPWKSLGHEYWAINIPVCMRLQGIGRYNLIVSYQYQLRNLVLMHLFKIFFIFIF